MKIAAFAQLRNELSKGNLENWFRCVTPLCDQLFIFDQNSTDGSIDYYKKQPKVKMILSNENRFYNEIQCKEFLLNVVYQSMPDVDWILWLDGDTLIDGRFTPRCLENVKEDAVAFGHLNLWRSDIHYRIDTQYHSLNESGVVCLWNAKKQRLTFPSTTGHHSRQYPQQIKNVKRLPYYLIHRGFSTDSQLIERYNLYKSFGQKGHSLERLLDEKELAVLDTPVNFYPLWFKPTLVAHPSTLKPIREIYNEQKH